MVVERREEKPIVMNAFELISRSQGFNLSTLFEKQMVSNSRIIVHPMYHIKAEILFLIRKTLLLLTLCSVARASCIL